MSAPLRLSRPTECRAIGDGSFAASQHQRLHGVFKQAQPATNANACNASRGVIVAQHHGAELPSPIVVMR